jgi:hypothetical protein
MESEHNIYLDDKYLIGSSFYKSKVKKTRVPLSSAFKSTSNYIGSLRKTDYQIPEN